jgi:hypothetical protein
LSVKDKRLIGLRNFAWDKGFPDLGKNTTLLCLRLYPKAKLALSNNKMFPASSSKGCCSMMDMIPSMLGYL